MQTSTALLLLMVQGPDNLRVMAHCFPDLKTCRSPAVIDEAGSQGLKKPLTTNDRATLEGCNSLNNVSHSGTRVN